MMADPDTLPSTPLSRARVACKACNARRVKCDAAEGQPCWHCRTRNTPCELKESRRGKYSRKRPSQRIEILRARGSRAPSSGDNQPPPTTEQFPDPIPGSTPPNASASESAVNLSYIVEVKYRTKDDTSSAEPLKVQYSIPASIANPPIPSHDTRAEALLALENALVTPPKGIADQLIRTFFEVIHPAYPVLDRSSFSRLYHQDRASPLVLQTIFMLGFTVSSDSLVQAAGYNDRDSAKITHYLRAKALYDVDYEKDQTLVAAVLLLLGFCWTGNDDQKDFCYWVGCAAMVAQSVGMHRSSSLQSTTPRSTALRKRIWWSIYIRDRHTSAAFGRPCRIRDEDCDVEPLGESDFSFDVDFDEDLIPVQTKYHLSYIQEMSKLAAILGDVLTGEFSARRAMSHVYTTNALAERLASWEYQLPETLHSKPPDETLGAPFWASMLQFSYQYCRILLFRPKPIDGLPSAEADRDVQARMAADAITRAAEDLLAVGSIRRSQIHL
ncbi:fungal-specific transcription factor domain-containing protein [Aspergillus heterothallicus]